MTPTTFETVQERYMLPADFWMDDDGNMVTADPHTTLPAVVRPSHTPVLYVGTVPYRIKQLVTDLIRTGMTQDEFSVMMRESSIRPLKDFIVKEFLQDRDGFADAMEDLGVTVANCNRSSTLILIVQEMILDISYKSVLTCDVRPQRNP